MQTTSQRGALAALLGLGLLLPVWAGSEAEIEDRAVAAVEAMNGIAIRDPNRPGKPVIRVELKGEKIKDRDLKPLLAFKQLYTLHLDNCAVNNLGLVTVGRLRTLKSLFLRCPRINDDNLQQLVDLKGLRLLDLSGTAVTGEGFTNLVALGELKQVYLRKAKVTDAGLRQIARLPKLESLFLDGTQITDAGLKLLGRARTLRSLNVRNTRVTDAGLKWLIKALPDCNLVR